MSGDRLVARRIVELDDSQEVRQCLQALFSFELENAELKVVQFFEKYDKETARFSKAWEPKTGEAE